jgi:hypothetical protein
MLYTPGLQRNDRALAVPLKVVEMGTNVQN